MPKRPDPPGIASLLEILNSGGTYSTLACQPIKKGRLPAPVRGVHDLSLAELLEAVGPDIRTSFADLFALVSEADTLLSDFLHAVANELRSEFLVTPSHAKLKDALSNPGIVVLKGPIKTELRALQKIVTKAGGDPSLLNDPVRGSIAADHIDDLPTLAHAMSAVGFDLATSAQSRHLENGLWDCQMCIRLPNAVLGEVQIHFKEMLERKEIGRGSDPPEHSLYKQRRAIEERAAVEGRSLTDEESNQCRSILEISRRWFDEAWERATRPKR